MSPSSAADEPPERIGPFQVQSVLGEGGMGVVYRAVAPDGTVAAVKVVGGDGVQGGERARRLRREAGIRVEHPNVVRTLDAGVDEWGHPWIAFELLEGASLEQWLERGPLSPEQAIRVGVETARGLGRAHAAGIVHRDLKPSNLFLCRDGTVKILDFGIAHLASHGTRLTATGQVVGTAAYVSPEQARGRGPVDGRSDLWALGVVLYEALSGRNPFVRDTPLASMLAVLAEPAPPLSVMAPELPAGLCAVVDRCLQMRPEERWPNADMLARALEEVNLGEPAAGGVAETVDSSLPAAPSIRPGEHRVVVVLLAEDVSEPSVLERAVTDAAGLYVPLGAARALGLFGADTWEGDEVERATRAALEARSSARSMAVASGRASYSGETGIVGAALAVAQQGCGAGRSGVAVDAASARALADLYELERVSDDWVEVVARTSGRAYTVSPRPLHDLTVGRDAELAQIRQSIRGVLEQGRAGVVLVTGPPGSGKSHLRHEVGRYLEHELSPAPRVVSARAEPLDREVGFALFRNLVRSRAEQGVEWSQWPRIDRHADAEQRVEAVRVLARDALGRGEHADECAAFLGELLQIPMPHTPSLQAARRDTGLMADRMRFALLDWLGGMCAQGRLALVLEDLQWADDSSLDLLEDMLDELGDAPLFLFATARPELVERRPRYLATAGATHLEPRGLLPSEVSELAQVLVGRELPESLVRQVTEHTAGNPLFVEQLLLTYRDERHFDENLSSLPLPISVEAAVQARLDHLPVQEKELLRRAAIADRSFTLEELESLGVHGPKRLLGELARRELVVTKRRGRRRGAREYQFRSRLVRDVCYRNLEASLRAELHGRLARHLQSTTGADPEEVAHHFDQALQTAQAVQWYVEAVHAASRRGDPLAVIRCTGRVFELGAPAERQSELHMKRSDALEVLGRIEEQHADLQAARPLARTQGELARVQTDWAVWCWRAGRAEEALESIAEAVEAARACGDRETLAIARGREAFILMYAGHLERAATALEEASSLAEQEGVHLQAFAATWRAQLDGLRGDHGRRRDAYERAMRLYDEAGDVRRAAGAELNLAHAYNPVGEYEKAEHALRDAVDKCRRVGNRMWEGYALANLGYALVHQDRIDEALSVLDRAQSVAAQVGEARLSLFVDIYRGKALRGRQPDEARTLARKAADAASGLRLHSMQILAQTVAASAELEWGRTERACELAGQALSLRDELGGVEEDEAEVYVVYARALEGCGRTEEAARVREAGRARLAEVAARIEDPEWRSRFLHGVPAHRELGPTE